MISLKALLAASLENGSDNDHQCASKFNQSLTYRHEKQVTLANKDFQEHYFHSRAQVLVVTTEF